MISYQVQSEKGFTDKIGELVCMLEHARAVTIAEVADLTKKELDTCDAGGNSIGALLSHIAAIEYVHQVISFEERDLTEEELAEWGAALKLGETARMNIHSSSIDDYLDVLEFTRDQTLELLKEKDDAWLYEERTWPNGVKYNPYYLWFHVMEDEINHRGQIRSMIRQRKEGLVQT
ncbi:DinB family protein [Halobacillus litoralis]|uniref:DinB family protein n=1 Tax=Halobacillus litoralis TaxID=45668 RepID=UPI001CFF4C5C|nr:DinB family protein [Halobacillus litoralis]